MSTTTDAMRTEIEPVKARSLVRQVDDGVGKVVVVIWAAESAWWA